MLKAIIKFFYSLFHKKEQATVGDLPQDDVKVVSCKVDKIQFKK